MLTSLASLSNSMKTLGWTFLIMLALSLQADAQIWLETFDDLANGATSDAGPTAWTTVQPSGAGRKFRKEKPVPTGTDYHLFEVDNTGSEGIWQSQVINISAAPEAALEVTLYSYFTFATDYIRCYYKLNGGSEVLFGELLGSNGLNITSAASAIVPGGSPGNTVQIIIRGFDATPGQDNSFGFNIDRALAFDDVTVTKIDVLYSIGLVTGANWDATNSWSLTRNGASCGCVPNNNSRVVITNLHPVNLNVAGTTAGVSVEANATLNWSANNLVLTMARGGTINIAANGTMSKNGRNGTSITYGNYIYSVVANGTLTLGDVNFGAGGSGSFSGTGTATLDNLNLSMGNGRSITNSMTGGAFTTARLFFNAANMAVINTGTFTVGNNGIVVVNNTINGNTLTNNISGTINISSFNLNDGNFLVNNLGTINQTGSFTNIDVGSNGLFDNKGTWNWTQSPTTFDADMATVFDLSTVANTFNYSASGNQTIVPTTYSTINLLSSGTKTAGTAFSATTLSVQNTASLATNAAVTVGANATFQNSATSSGTSTLTVGGNLNVLDSSTPTSSGAITVGGGVLVSTSAVLGGAGNLTVGGVLTIQNTAQVNRGTGTIDLNGNLIISNTGILAGTGPVNIAGNWTATNAGSFTEGTRTVTFDGTANQTITNVSGETFATLAINKNTGDILLGTGASSTDITINTNLTLTKGRLFTTANDLITIISGADTNGGTATSFVDGPIRKIGILPATFIFPTGDNNIWARIGFTYGLNATAASEFTARYFDAAYPDLSNNGTMNNISGKEYWTLDRAVTNTAQGQVQLFWESNTRSGITVATSDLIVGHYTSPDWFSEGKSATSGTLATGSITSNTVTSFSPFTFGSLGHPANPLPVTLTTFSARLQNDVVDVNWTTASELNNASFTVERGADIENFEPLQTVIGHGTTAESNAYTIIDNNPLPGRSYYRLRQTDFDGRFTYYNVVLVNHDGPGFAALRAYPNPTIGNNITVDVVGLKNETAVVVELINTKGERVYQQEVPVAGAGRLTQQFTFPDSILPGLYILKAGRTSYLTQKIIIQ